MFTYASDEHGGDAPDNQTDQQRHKYALDPLRLHRDVGTRRLGDDLEVELLALGFVARGFL